MPKPVKKAAKKKPATDPNRRARQLMDEQLAKMDEGKWKDEPAPQPEPALSFDEQFKARMAELGRKGGKVGGKRRLETMTDQERIDAARKAAAARWKNREGKP